MLQAGAVPVQVPPQAAPEQVNVPPPQVTVQAPVQVPLIEQEAEVAGLVAVQLLSATVVPSLRWQVTVRVCKQVVLLQLL